MKKQLITASIVFALTACGGNNSTLFDFFSSDNEENSNTIVLGPEAAGSGYRLAKRSDRYAMTDYVITPQEYAIVATRTVNKMLAEAPALFAANKDAPLYIADTILIDRYLPGGSEAAGNTAKEILINSKMFNLVDDKSKAEYILKSSLNNANTPEVPVLIFRLELYDKTEENLLGNWWDTLRQVQNDDGSWW